MEGEAGRGSAPTPRNRAREGFLQPSLVFGQFG